MNITDSILCGANAYEQKYYFNEKFNRLPESVKEELHIMCVLFTEDVGGTIQLKFDEDGKLIIETDCNEDDILYDEIGSVLKVKQIQSQKAELLESLEQYYKVFFLGENLSC